MRITILDTGGSDNGLAIHDWQLMKPIGPWAFQDSEIISLVKSFDPFWEPSRFWNSKRLYDEAKLRLWDLGLYGKPFDSENPIAPKPKG